MVIDTSTVQGTPDRGKVPRERFGAHPVLAVAQLPMWGYPKIEYRAR
jgi:hypothetical protein